jgi:hypothetical protein
MSGIISSVSSRGTLLARFLSVLIGGLAAAGSASAESAFILAWPASLGRVPAATYDDHGAPLGDANLVIERVGKGIRVFSQSGETHGAHTVATADLVPVETGAGLRLVRQESHSFDPQGRSLGQLSIDHVAQRAHCSDANGRVDSELELPATDRVVNVPFNLLFLPLVRGETQQLSFQLFLCRDGARLLDFQAWVAEHAENVGTGPVEIRYAPDLGLMSPFARQLVPRLSFWFDPRAPHGWVAHRLPLYTGGPEVLVVREGISTATLGN